MNERDYPHIVELPLPSIGFRSQSDDLMAFHRERGIVPRRGVGWHDDEQYYVRYCFADLAQRRRLPRMVWWREDKRVPTSRQGARVIEHSRRMRVADRWPDTGRQGRRSATEALSTLHPLPTP
jgi:hypothetical protein